MQQLGRKKLLGFLGGLAVLSLSAASLQAQDTTTAGQARMDTSAVDSTKHDSTMHDSTASDTTKQDTLKQNPPGYRGMEQDTSSVSGDTSAAAARDQTTGAYNDSTWRDSAGLNREKGSDIPGDTTASDSSRMGP
jgi:hypothetical protein